MIGQGQWVQLTALEEISSRRLVLGQRGMVVPQPEELIGTGKWLVRFLLLEGEDGEGSDPPVTEPILESNLRVVMGPSRLLAGEAGEEPVGGPMQTPLEGSVATAKEELGGLGLVAPPPQTEDCLLYTSDAADE